MGEPERDFRIRFAVFELDTRSGELRKAGSRVKLQDQPLKVLTALLERPGEVVTREELKRRIWPEDSLATLTTPLTSPSPNSGPHWETPRMFRASLKLSLAAAIVSSSPSRRQGKRSLALPLLPPRPN